jgi:hypothetical protein
VGRDAKAGAGVEVTDSVRPWLCYAAQISSRQSIQVFPHAPPCDLILTFLKYAIL